MKTIKRTRILSLLAAILCFTLLLSSCGYSKKETDEKLATIDEQISAIKTTLPTLEATSTELGGYIDTLEATAAELETKLDATNASIEALRTEIEADISASDKAALDNLNATKTELEGKIAAANKAIEDAKAANTASEKAITDQIAALEAELEKADADNKKALEDSIAALETALTKADADNKKALQDSIAALKTAMEAGDASLTTAIQTLNTNLSALIKTNADNIAVLQTTATNLQTQINDTNAKIDNLKTELEGKIADSEKKVLDGLNALKTDIVGQIATINNTIATLQAKDAELDQKIADLKTYVDNTLANYATKDWANATFTTLEQYEEMQTVISEINALIKSTQESIAALEEKLNKKIADDIAAAVADVNSDIADKVTVITNGYTTAIANATDAITEAYTAAIEAAVNGLEIKMQGWVNEKLQQPLKDIADLQAALTALTGEVATDEELAAAVEAQRAALTQAKKDLTAAYEKAIADAVADGGIISDAIAAAVQTAQDALQEKINEITVRVDNIEKSLEDLKIRFANRIQSLTFMPQYSDGKVEMDYKTRTTQAFFRISPAEIEKLITDENVKAFARYTNDPITRASYHSEIPLSVISVLGDDTGMLEVNIAESDEYLLSTEFWQGRVEAVIYIQITDNYGNKVVSDAIPMIAHNYVGNTNSINGFGDGGTQSGEAGN